jgi:hypothetical protein
MKTLQDKAKIDNEIMEVLKIPFIDTIIAHTSKGNLTLRLMKDQTSDEYNFVLDSVLVSKEVNKFLLSKYNGIIYVLE